MARIRFKSPTSFNRSELAEESFQKWLELPEKDDLVPEDQVLGCNGRETLAVEMFRKIAQVLENSAMCVDVSFPMAIAEKLMLQILPGEPLVRFPEVPVGPVEACGWFENDVGSGSVPVSQVMAIDGVPSRKLLLEMDSGVDEVFRKLKVQDFEAAPASSPSSLREEIELQKAIPGLDDAILQSNSETADCRLAEEKPFENMPDSQKVEPCATPPKAEYECEDLSDDLSCLLDSPGTAPSICGDPDVGAARQPLPQKRGSCFASLCNILLEDSSIDSSIRAMKTLQRLNVSEKLTVRFEQDPIVKTTSHSAVTSVDLTSADDSSPSDAMVHDIEEDSGIRSQERRAGASLELKCEDSPCTGAKNDNSDHSTLSDEKTTSPIAPVPSDSTKNVSVITAPPSSVAEAPLEQPKTEELLIETKRQPLVIVAANVMQADGPVIPRRNSSYQRILALENEQVQVAERERHLPVDLILSPSTCLIVYTAATMKLNWKADSSFVCKERSAFIANTVIDCQMKAMSFSFAKCYMVFEGEPEFTSFIRQATSKLAVAAAGFGTQVQCFMSGSPQCTEGIALMCIERMRKKAKRSYSSVMPECENDGEMFLDQFPSLNPLAAHAILGLDVPLSKFLLWSHDAMADALQGFEVPAESLRLFKLQAEHGKLKEGQVLPEEIDFPFLPPTSSGTVDDFDIAPFNDGPRRSDNRKPFRSSLDRILDIDDGPTSDENIVLSPPFGPLFKSDPKFDEEFTSDRSFNFWDGPNQEHRPLELWPEERPTQRPTTNGSSNRSRKPEYTQSCLDDWILKMKRDSALSVPKSTKQEFKSEFLDLGEAPLPSQARREGPFSTMNFELHGRGKVQSSTLSATKQDIKSEFLDLAEGSLPSQARQFPIMNFELHGREKVHSVPNSTKQGFKSEFLELAEASLPSQARREGLFPTLNFELNGREKQQSSKVNVTPGKRAASALDLYRHQKGISRPPLQKKLKPLSRPPHLRSNVVDASSVEAARAHLSKRFCFKPATTPSRLSRPS